MKDLIFWVAAALYLGVMGLALLNRSSEKILTTLFLGLAALLAAIVSVALYSSEGPIYRAFSVPIIIQADTKLPFEGFPYPVLPMEFAIRVREKLIAYPELRPDPKVDSFARSTYHHALQRAIVYWLVFLQRDRSQNFSCC